MTALPDSITRLLRTPNADDVYQAAEHVSGLMKAIYGGEWRIQVNLEEKFEMIIPRLGSRRA